VTLGSTKLRSWTLDFDRVSGATADTRNVYFRFLLQPFCSVKPPPIFAVLIRSVTFPLGVYYYTRRHFSYCQTSLRADLVCTLQFVRAAALQRKAYTLFVVTSLSITLLRVPLKFFDKLTGFLRKPSPMSFALYHRGVSHDPSFSHFARLCFWTGYTKLSQFYSA